MESETATLASREQRRDRCGQNRDPIHDDRLLWRAQTFRHLVHLLPGESILRLGCGRGPYRPLVRAGDARFTWREHGSPPKRPDAATSSRRLEASSLGI